MPNTREKLIELLLDVDAVCTRDDCRECYKENCFIHRAVNHLISNGVTIQDDHHWATEQAYKNGYADGQPKWISVKERLPDKDGTYLVRWENKSVSDAEYESLYGSFGHWLDFWLDKEAEWVEYDGITHWMPLPEAPKGE